MNRLNHTTLLEEINKNFYSFIDELLAKKKYYYWSLEYFERMNDILLQHYELSPNDKNIINSEFSSIFEDKAIKFSIKSSALKNEIQIQNITKITSVSKASEYIKEYILYVILKEMNDNKEYKADGKSFIDNSVLEKQKKNFMFSYMKYLLEEKETYCQKEYLKFGTYRNQKDFIAELEEKDDEESKALLQRLKTLYVKKSDKPINFVFKASDEDDKQELRFALQKLSKNKSELTFRGQANADWNLSPSIARKRQLLENEHELFHKILALKPHDFVNDLTDYEKLITMQHYGLPTRLLDVTRNPLVAIFFACNNWERRYQDGLVYVFEEDQKSEEHKFLNPDDDTVKCLTKIVKSKDHKVCENCKSQEVGQSCNFSDKSFMQKNHFIRGIAKNRRIDNQSGDFIFVGTDKNSKENKAVDELVSEYLVIDHEVKPILLENLEVMNIHGGSVYPELGNMSSYLVAKYSK